MLFCLKKSPYSATPPPPPFIILGEYPPPPGFCVQSAPKTENFPYFCPSPPNPKNGSTPLVSLSILDRAFTVGRFCTLKITLFGLLKCNLGRLCSVLGVRHNANPLLPPYHFYCPIKGRGQLGGGGSCENGCCAPMHTHVKINHGFSMITMVKPWFYHGNHGKTMVFMVLP